MCLQIVCLFRKNTKSFVRKQQSLTIDQLLDSNSDRIRRRYLPPSNSTQDLKSIVDLLYVFKTITLCKFNLQQVLRRETQERDSFSPIFFFFFFCFDWKKNKNNDDENSQNLKLIDLKRKKKKNWVRSRIRYQVYHACTIGVRNAAVDSQCFHCDFPKSKIKKNETTIRKTKRWEIYSRNCCNIDRIRVDRENIWNFVFCFFVKKMEIITNI